MSAWDPMDYSPQAATVDRVIRGQRQRAGMSDAPLYPSQDGPSAGTVVEVTDHVMVGTDRSTVVVRRGGEPILLNEVRGHGAETDGIGAVVEAAVREGVKISKQ